MSTLNKITDLTLDEINNVVDLRIVQPIVDATSYDNFIDGLHFEGLVLPNLIKECLSENMYKEYKETVIGQLLPHMKSLKNVEFNWHHGKSQLNSIKGKKVIFNVDPVEQHGPHLTLGTDINISNGIIKYLCGIKDFIQVSGINIGCMRWALALGGSLSVSESFLKEYIERYIERLLNLGASEIVLVSTHLAPNHHAVLDNILSKYKNGTVNVLYPLLQLEETNLDCHAGVVETALSAYLGNRVQYELFNKELFTGALSTEYIYSISNLQLSEFSKAVKRKQWNGIVGDFSLFKYEENNCVEYDLKLLGEKYFRTIVNRLAKRL